MTMRDSETDIITEGRKKTSSTKTQKDEGEEITSPSLRSIDKANMTSEIISVNKLLQSINKAE